MSVVLVLNRASSYLCVRVQFLSSLKTAWLTWLYLVPRSRILHRLAGNHLACWSNRVMSFFFQLQRCRQTCRICVQRCRIMFQRCWKKTVWLGRYPENRHWFWYCVYPLARVVFLYYLLVVVGTWLECSDDFITSSFLLSKCYNECIGQKICDDDME